MSSKANKIAKQAEANQKLKKYALYGTVVGSCLVTIGKLAKKTEKELMKDFIEFSKNTTDPLWNCKTIKEVCNYFIDFYKMPEEYKKNIVLVYDESNIYTPIVTLEVENNILPLDPAGMTLGVLNHLDKAVVEYIYDEENEDRIEG